MSALQLMYKSNLIITIKTIELYLCIAVANMRGVQHLF
jgi:hypothetical protein